MDHHRTAFGSNHQFDNVLMRSFDDESLDNFWEFPAEPNVPTHAGPLHHDDGTLDSFGLMSLQESSSSSPPSTIKTEPHESPLFVEGFNVSHPLGEHDSSRTFPSNNVVVKHDVDHQMMDVESFHPPHLHDEKLPLGISLVPSNLDVAQPTSTGASSIPTLSPSSISTPPTMTAKVEPKVDNANLCSPSANQVTTTTVNPSAIRSKPPPKKLKTTSGRGGAGSKGTSRGSDGSGQFIESLRGLNSTQLQSIMAERNLSPSEEKDLKVYLRKIKNRESAHLSRERRKLQLESLETQLAALERTERDLVREKIEVEVENRVLKQQLAEFEAVVFRGVESQRKLLAALKGPKTPAPSKPPLSASGSIMPVDKWTTAMSLLILINAYAKYNPKFADVIPSDMTEYVGMHQIPVM